PAAPRVAEWSPHHRCPPRLRPAIRRQVDPSTPRSWRGRRKRRSGCGSLYALGREASDGHCLPISAGPCRVPVVVAGEARTIDFVLNALTLRAVIVRHGNDPAPGRLLYRIIRIEHHQSAVRGPVQIQPPTGILWRRRNDDGVQLAAGDIVAVDHPSF